MTYALLPWFTPAAQGEDFLKYRFEEGEGAAYHLQVVITNDSLTDSKFFNHLGSGQRKEGVHLDLDYTLMPITQRSNAIWDIRLVLERVQQEIHSDGEVKKTLLDAETLRKRRHPPSEIFKIDLQQASLAALLARLNTNSPPTGNAPSLHTQDELVEEPLLVGMAPDGSIAQFEERSELQQVMPGIEFRHSLQWVLPPLPRVALKVGTEWKRSVPLDWPIPPLSNAVVEPMFLELSYQVQKLELVEGHPCAHIQMHGEIERKNLQVPVRQEELMHLIWTTFICRVRDQVEGEFVFDLAEGKMRASEIRSRYQFSTWAGRKADQYRGRIASENEMNSRLSNRLQPVKAS